MLKLAAIPLAFPLITLLACAPARSVPREAAAPPPREALKAIWEVRVTDCAASLEDPAADPVVHATVVFADDGSVATVTLDGRPPELGDAAARCLEDKLRAPKVGPLGHRIMIGRTVRLRPHDAPVGTSAPFSRRDTARALGSINVTPCFLPDGPAGSGHLVLDFAPDGTLVGAEVDVPPFLATSEAICVEERFMDARIPAFAGGEPIRVGKSFSLP